MTSTDPTQDDFVDGDPGGDPMPPELPQPLDPRFRAYVQQLRGATPLLGLPYPDPTDPVAEGADAIRALAEAVENAFGNAAGRASNGGGSLQPKAGMAVVPVSSAEAKNLSFADNTYTIQAAGFYILAGDISLPSASSGESYGVAVYVGESIGSGVSQTSGLLPQANRLSCATVRRLTPGQKVTLRAYQNTDGVMVIQDAHLSLTRVWG